MIPCGVKEPEEEGGGPAGVVEGLLKRLRDLSGVEGGVESGTVKTILDDCRWKTRVFELSVIKLTAGDLLLAG